MKAPYLALLLVAAACSRTPRPEGSPSPAQDAPTTVKVVNDNVLDMNVFVVPNNGQRFRLGSVTGGHTEVFTIPKALVSYGSQLVFAVRPVAGSTTDRTQRITVSPGDQVTLMVPP
jgi:hypothetical protein